jgi:hypothetical protein
VRGERLEGSKVQENERKVKRLLYFVLHGERKERKRAR